MTAPGMRELLDRITRERPPLGETPQPAIGVDTLARNPLGLLFPPGTRVIDLATGARGTVQSGQRDAANNEQVFRVQLADARAVYRHAGELERDPRPASTGA